jgi:hypothetical protein
MREYRSMQDVVGGDEQSEGYEPKQVGGGGRLLVTGKNCKRDQAQGQSQHPRRRYGPHTTPDRIRKWTLLLTGRHTSPLRSSDSMRDFLDSMGLEEVPAQCRDYT